MLFIQLLCESGIKEIDQLLSDSLLYCELVRLR